MSVHDIFESRRNASSEDPLERQFLMFLVESISNLQMAQSAFRKLREVEPSAELDRLDADISQLNAELTEMFGCKCPTRSQLAEIQRRVSQLVQSREMICDVDSIELKVKDAVR